MRERERERERENLGEDGLCGLLLTCYGCVRMAGGLLYVAFLSFFTLVPALHTTFNIDEINAVHYAVDILHKPVIKDQVSVN